MVEFFIFNEVFIAEMLIFVTVAVTLSLEAGYTGVPNFGKAVFVFIGAFALSGVGVRVAAYMLELRAPGLVEEIKAKHPLARGDSLVDLAGDANLNRIVVSNYLDPFIHGNLGVSIFLLVVLIGAAAFMGIVLGLVASYAALRLKEDYLAILLLSFSELTVTVVFEQVNTLNGGPKGLWAVTFADNTVRLSMILAGLLAAGTYLYASRLANSPMGRLMRAVRDDDLAASVYGRNVASTRLKVIIVAAVIAAIAGAVWTMSHTYVKAGNFDRVTWTFYIWAMVILGGISNVNGAVLGALVISIGRRLIDYYSVPIANTLGLEETIAEAVLANVLVGSLILLVLYVRPQGIMEEKPSRTYSEKELK